MSGAIVTIVVETHSDIRVAVALDQLGHAISD